MTAAEVGAALAKQEAEYQAQRARIVSHVRQPLPRQRTGNQFYKDRGLTRRFGPQRGTTLCGAEPTTEDLDLRGARSAERKGSLNQYVRCPDCRERVRAAR